LCAPLPGRNCAGEYGPKCGAYFPRGARTQAGCLRTLTAAARRSAFRLPFSDGVPSGNDLFFNYIAELVLLEQVPSGCCIYGTPAKICGKTPTTLCKGNGFWWHPTLKINAGGRANGNAVPAK